MSLLSHFINVGSKQKKRVEDFFFLNAWRPLQTDKITFKHFFTS